MGVLGRPLPHSSDTDVAANREARISETQLLDLIYSGLWRVLLGMPIAVIGAAIALVAPSGGGDVFLGLGLVALMVSGICLFGAGAYGSWRGFNFLDDARTRKVAYVTGQLDRRAQTYRGRTTYYMTVGPVSTRIPRETFDALPAGLNCHVYYAAASLHLLSLEPATAETPHPSLTVAGNATLGSERVRQLGLIAAAAVFGIAAGLNDSVIAHPARSVEVSGTIASYHQGRGVNDSGYVVLEGSPTQYSTVPMALFSTPRLPDLNSYIGEPADVYVNADGGGRDVLALRVRDTFYEGELYLHPEHQYWAMLISGSLVMLLSAIIVVVMVRRINRLRKHGTSGSEEIAKTATDTT
jgi:hypothetical protein